MKHCSSTKNLEVHHIRRDGENDLKNAIVLCQKRNAATSSYGTPRKSPLEFSPLTKSVALTIANHCCQCISTSGCH